MSRLLRFVSINWRAWALFGAIMNGVAVASAGEDAPFLAFVFAAFCMVCCFVFARWTRPTGENDE